MPTAIAKGFSLLRFTSSLVEINVDGCKHFDSDVLARIANAVKGTLRTLSARWTCLDDDACGSIESFCALENVALSSCDISEKGLAKLAAHASRLVSLDLCRCRSIGRSLAPLGEMARLEQLNVENCADLCIVIPHSMPRLRDANLAYTRADDNTLAALATSPHLEHLRLEACEGVSARGLGAVAKQGVLKRLDLADTSVENADIRSLRDLNALAELNLFGTNVTEAAVMWLSKHHKGIQSINLDAREIADSALRRIGSFSDLRHLDLFGASISDAGCAHLAKANLGALRSLELCSGHITDRGVRCLCTIRSLVSLNMSQNKRITNAGARHIAHNLVQLLSLNLSQTSVDSSGALALVDLPSISSLALYGCDVSEASIEYLRESLLHLRFIGHSAAMLVNAFNCNIKYFKTKYITIFCK